MHIAHCIHKHRSPVLWGFRNIFNAQRVFYKESHIMPLSTKLCAILCSALCNCNEIMGDGYALVGWEVLLMFKTGTIFGCSVKIQKFSMHKLRFWLLSCHCKKRGEMEIQARKCASKALVKNVNICISSMQNAENHCSSCLPLIEFHQLKCGWSLFGKYRCNAIVMMIVYTCMHRF